ncbi:MAG: 2-oxoacid:acceptor oxidoreductase family protein [Atribacterota bacterium]|jgi:2-oxoglutarate ferredoxin oxidoreductase subunit gamma|nr:2-oxoacid:acceptor oxidoreductase family protein [Atribacterota bacterium]MDD5496850.1 2-oxoacid:acceptor oxidoreductase family protein [Atribacterota bacterium]
MRKEICLSGSGGQGLILAGIILAEAAGIYDGFEVTQTQSYGPEARGGASRSEVIISNEKIDYPKIIKSDILLALTQKACDKYVQNLKDDGILLVDSTDVVKIPSFSGKIYQYPITEDALKILGNQLVANIISLGIMVQLTAIVSQDAIKKAVEARIPERIKDLNKRALEHGFQIGVKLNN